jgi:methylated-DNA-[protein]-cysteine S-methyltransferase
MEGVIAAYYQSPVGALSIHTDGNFITQLRFVDKGDDVAEIISHPLLQQCFDELDAYFSGAGRKFSFPVRQEGTTFQQSVWAELEKIPYGKTISYLELSKRIKNIKAIRAVGTANGSNKVAIIVPCHRVIGSNGSLVGFGGGLWRKKWLLEHEAKFAVGLQMLFYIIPFMANIA